MLSRIVLSLIVYAVFTASAQTPASSSAQPTTLEVLLNEVRALRLAIERTNQFGPKIQIALARMQFQEQRVRSLTQQVESANREVSSIQMKRGELADRIKLSETQPNSIADPASRKQMEYELAQAKAELERLNAVEQQFRSRESELNVLLQTEQAKWNEINDQLVSFEHALSVQQVGTPRP